jgi:cysteine synthase
MIRVWPGVLEAIGNTPIVRLQRVVPTGSADVLVKLEFANPTGTMKDRVAKAMVEAAERDGRLRPGGTVVEYTGGSTGVSLALVCAAKGYRLRVVFSDAFSDEKRRMMQAFGAEVQDVKSRDRKFDAALFREMIETARRVGEAPGHWFCDQLNNADGKSGYRPLGEEIWRQTDGNVSAFVQSVGTAHSLHGTMDALRERRGSIRAVAVEPAESAVLSGGASGAHGIEGIGTGFVPPLWEPEHVDEIIAVSTPQAMAMTRRLALEEGIFAGTSSGGNVVAAIQVAQRLGPGKIVVTVMVDSGLRYLSTELYR